MALIYEIVNNTISVDRPIQFRVKEEDGGDMSFTTDGQLFIDYVNGEDQTGDSIGSYQLNMRDIRGSLGFYNGFNDWAGLASDIPIENYWEDPQWQHGLLLGEWNELPHATDHGNYISFRKHPSNTFQEKFMPYAFSIELPDHDEDNAIGVYAEWEVQNFSAIFTIPSLLQVAPEYTTSTGHLAGIGVYDNGNPYIMCNGIGMWYNVSYGYVFQTIDNYRPFATIGNYNDPDVSPNYYEIYSNALSNEWFDLNQQQFSRVDGQTITSAQPNQPIDVESLIGTQILFNTSFKLSKNVSGGLVSQFDIKPSTYGGTHNFFDFVDYYNHYHKCTFFVGESSNFGLNILNVSLPQSIPENTTADGTVTIASEDFSGSAIMVFADQNFTADSPQFDLFSEVWGADNITNEDVIANYGTILTDGAYSYIIFNISKQEVLEFPFTYTSNDVSDNQSDMFGMFVYTFDLMLSDYENPTDAQLQYDEYSPHYNYVDNLSIAIQDEVIIPDEDQPSNNIIVKPSDIMYHIVAEELGYDKEVDSNSIRESRIEHNGGNMAFTVNDKINSKNLFQEISQSSKSYPTFSNDRLRFINLKDQHIGASQGEQILTIKSSDVISFDFDRTEITELKTQVEVKYKYDYGRKEYTETTGEIRVDEHYLQNRYFTTGSYKQHIDETIPNDINYYGLKNVDNFIDHIDTFLVHESKYIRDYETALKLAQHLLAWKCNQHNTVELVLPLKYYNLEIGDLVDLDRMLLDKKLYGEPYVLEDPEDMPIRCGQLILPLFMVYKVRKGMSNIKIDLVQIHHLGFQDLHYNDYVYSNAGYFFGIMGDINNDGVIDVLDIVLLVNHISSVGDGSVWELTGSQLQRADFNQDGFVDVLDVIAMVQEMLSQEADPYSTETFNNIRSNPKATTTRLLYEKNKVELETNGEIAAIEISYNGKFSGTKKLGKGWSIKTGKNKILIYSLGKSSIQNLLFTYSGSIRINYARCFAWDSTLHYAPARNMRDDTWRSRNTTWATETRKPEEIKQNLGNRIIRKSRI